MFITKYVNKVKARKILISAIFINLIIWIIIDIILLRLYIDIDFYKIFNNINHYSYTIQLTVGNIIGCKCWDIKYENRSS